MLRGRNVLQRQSAVKQGRVHSGTVADGFAGAVMQTTAHNLKSFVTNRPTDLPTDTARLWSCVFATKNMVKM